MRVVLSSASALWSYIIIRDCSRAACSAAFNQRDLYCFVFFSWWVHAIVRCHRKYCVHENSRNERLITHIWLLFQVSRAYVGLTTSDNIYSYHVFVFWARRVPSVNAAQFALLSFVIAILTATSVRKNGITLVVDFQCEPYL